MLPFDLKFIKKTDLNPLNIPISGENAKQTFLAVYEDDVTDESIVFLKRMLNAIGHNLESDDVLLHLPEDESFSVATLKQTHDIKNVLLFGVTWQEAGLNLHVAEYTPIFVNELWVLRSERLSKLQNNPAAKAKLWEALKVMFLNK